MNLALYRLFFLSFLTAFIGNGSLSATESPFFSAAQEQVDKVSNKTQIVHKSPLEFKQAVIRYIKYTDTHCLQSHQRGSDENVSYKKELRYLFKNYDSFATSVLLSRLRSAHQDMVRLEHDAESDSYKRYEQISSALLLTCAQVFCNDVRNQILNALDEIDNNIVYWRYQQHHQLSYFFSKSPTKWIMGKAQAKEIANNINKLTRKQRELYTLLGSLTGHIHLFTEAGVEFNDCYAWIDTLFEVLSSIQVSSHYNSDGTKFDELAAELGLKVRRVSELKSTFLSSIVSAKKPNHLVRHWIAYTTILAAAGYAAHYHQYHPEFIPGALVATQIESLKFFNLLIDPFKKVYKRAEIAFSTTIVEDKHKPLSDSSIKSKDELGIDLIKVRSDSKDDRQEDVDSLQNFSLEELCDQLEMLGKEITADIGNELAKSNSTVRADAVDLLNDVVKDTEEKWFKYNFDVKAMKADLQLIKSNNDQDAYKRVHESLQKLSAQTWQSPQGYSLWLKINRGDGLLRVVNDYLDPLQIYTDIVDEKILKSIRVTIVLAEKLIKRGDELAKEADELVLVAKDFIERGEALAKEADAKLQDNELTLMFTTLIPLISACFGITKTYGWATARDYSPIRIALADVNALLIESEMQLDDHGYGKLVYLICKLRHKTSSLKDSLSHEFLADVAKLESKQYTPHIKRGIVENMFNKYAFLGRIAA